MTIDLAALVARATAAHAASAPAPLVRVTRSPSTGRMVKATAPSAPVKVAAPVAVKVATVATAEQYRSALRDAAKIKGAEARIAAERDAILAFMGSYPMGGYHPKAVNDALATANKLILDAKRGPVALGPSREEQRAHLATLKGYVAGVNDAAERAERDAAARRRILVALVLDLRKVTTREGLHSALVAGGRDDAKFALYLASDAEAIEAARDMAGDLAREHGIAE